MKEEKNKMHVLQVVGEPIGGIRRHVHDIIRNYTVDKYIYSYVHSKHNLDKSFFSQIIELDKRLNNRLILDIRKKPHFTDVINIIKLIIFVKNNNISVIHGHGAKGGLYARVVSCFTNVKSVYTPHGGSLHDMFSRLTNITYAYVEKLLVFCTDFFIFESNYTYKRFRATIKYNIDKFVVNSNGIEADFGDGYNENNKRNTDKKNTLNVGVFGVLRKEKGQINALLMMPYLVNYDLRVSLHIVGRGPDNSSLKELVIENKLSDRVVFYGEVDDVREIMSKMDIVLIPSIFESFGYIAIESMSMKKPVIASNVGGLKDIIVNEKTGILFDINEPEDIARALLKWDSKSLEEQKEIIGNACQIVNEKYNLNVMIDRIENVYSKVAGA